MRQDLKIISSLISAKSKVLDIGCSTGELLLLLQKEKQVDGRGIDIEQASVSHCVQQGLTVIQGDADHDLKHYPDLGFDYVISSQVLQATNKPYDVLQEMLRIGKHVVVSIPNFGHWKNRLYLLLHGRMPVTKNLSYEWYETPNIHFCTVKDFHVLCEELKCDVERVEYLDGENEKLSPLCSRFANWCSGKAVFLLRAR